MSGRSSEPFASLPEPELPRQTLAKVESNSTERAFDEKPLGPAWKRVVYRGRVLASGNPRGVPGAVVSVFEGEDRLFTTITDEEGMFELPADLYGLEIEKRSGEGAGWRPETYYRLRVDAGSVGRTERPLADIRLDERLVLHVG